MAAAMGRNGRAWLVGALGWALMLAPAQAADAVGSHKLIAVYLFNFTNYIEWPDSRDRFRVCVVGDADVQAALSYIQGQRREISVSTIAQPDAVASCDVVYLGDDVTASQIPPYLAATKERAVLTVSADGNFQSLGGHIQFVFSDGALKLRINKTLLDQAGFKTSAKLLSLAEVVK